MYGIAYPIAMKPKSLDQIYLSKMHAGVAFKQRPFHSFLSANLLLHIFYSHTYIAANHYFTICWRLLPTFGFRLKTTAKITHEPFLPQNLEFYNSFIKGMWGFLQVSHSLSSFISVSGLKCYDCTGTEDDCAKDKLKADNSTHRTCPSGRDKCIRTWSKNDDVTRVINTCSNEALCKAAEDACSKGCAASCCDTDLCNAGSPVSFSVFLMTVCSAIGLVLLK